MSKVGARRDESGRWFPYDEPDQLRQGIEDNLRSLGVEQLAAVNLRVMVDATPDERFDDQLAAMIQARDEGLIGGVGLSNVTREQLLRALARTEVACVQNPLNLADRASMPVLEECIPVLDNEQVPSIAERLGITPAQVALAWTVSLAPNVLLIPGTSSVRHLEENLAVADIDLDDGAQQQLAAITA